MFCYKTLLQSASLVLLTLFYILLFSVHIVNVNVAKSSTVLDNLSVKKKYIYIFFVRVKAVIWETLCTCYFCSMSLSFFFAKALHFKRWVQGSPMTCALMVSSLRLSTCLIYDKWVQVIYCSLSWHWYIFETRNLLDRIDFIMFLVANEKQCLSVVLITRHFL